LIGFCRTASYAWTIDEGNERKSKEGNGLPAIMDPFIDLFAHPGQCCLILRYSVAEADNASRGADQA